MKNHRLVAWHAYYMEYAIETTAVNVGAGSDDDEGSDYVPSFYKLIPRVRR